jgi:hypothetical protein
MPLTMTRMKIIGYSPIDKTLIVYPGPDGVEKPQEMDISQEIALVLKKRGCAGTWDGDEYIACDSSDAPCCNRHGGPPDPCVACRGDCLKQKKTCNSEYSVYLALFAPDIIKVGVSKTPRLKIRLNEQGADAGVEIARYPDGELARKRERSLAATYPDRIAFDVKLNGITKKIDARTLQDIYSKYDAGQVMNFKYFDKILWMQPIVLEPKEAMAISGRVLGIKGKALVLEKSSTIYAINLDGLIGYEFKAGKGMLNLQTSLFEFAKKEIALNEKLI